MRLVTPIKCEIRQRNGLQLPRAPSRHSGRSRLGDVIKRNSSLSLAKSQGESSTHRHGRRSHIPHLQAEWCARLRLSECQVDGIGNQRSGGLNPLALLRYNAIDTESTELRNWMEKFCGIILTWFLFRSINSRPAAPAHVRPLAVLDSVSSFYHVQQRLSHIP